MAHLDWYNVNAHRAFPFVATPAHLPDSAILDAGVVAGIESEYGLTADDTVKLVQIIQTPPYASLRLVFQVDTPAMADSIRLVGDGGPYQIIELTPYHCDESGVLGAEVDEAEKVRWGHGFVVVGDTTGVEDGTSSIAAELEPSRVQSMYNLAASRLSLLHREPTHWAEPGETPEPEELLLLASDLAGTLLLADGYNTEVIMDVGSSSLVIRSGVGAGEGPPCDWEVPEGQPQCGDLVASINGIRATETGVFMMMGGLNLQVIPHPTLDHTLLVGVGPVSNLFCGSLEA